MTSAVEREREMLIQSERHIADAELLISRQEMLIWRLDADGHDTSLAKEALATYLCTLEQHRTHRGLILERIAWLEAEKLPGERNRDVG